MTQLCWLGRTLKKYWTTGEQRTSFNSSRAVRCDVSRFVLCSIINLIVSVFTFWLYMRFLHIAHPHTSPFLHDGGHLRLQKQRISLFFNCTTALRVERRGRTLTSACDLTFGDHYSCQWPFICTFTTSLRGFLALRSSRNILSRPLSLLTLPKYVFTSRSQSSLEVSVVSNKSWWSIIIWKTKKKSKTPWQLRNFHPYLPVELGRFPSERPDNKRAAN